MKHVKKALFILILAISMSSTCKKNDGHEYVTFANESDKEIVCQRFLSKSIDTLFRCRTGAIGIPAGSLYGFPSGDRSWEADLRDSYYVHFLVMDAETYDKYITAPCDTIRKYVPILHTYRITLSDLQRMNWTVVYPPYQE